MRYNRIIILLFNRNHHNGCSPKDLSLIEQFVKLDADVRKMERERKRPKYQHHILSPLARDPEANKSSRKNPDDDKDILKQAK